MMINMSNASLLIPYLKDPWTASWIISGLVTIVAPVIIWNVHKSTYFNNYGAYQKSQDYYEEQQWYYEQQQEYYNNNNNNNNNDDDGNDDGNQQSYYKECSWINWPCRRRQWMYATYSQDNGNGDGNTENVPAWYVFLGGETEAMERWREENTDDERNNRNNNNNNRNGSTNTGGLNFVYFLTLVLFIGVVALGAKEIAKRRSSFHLSILLVITMVIVLMNLVMSVNLISVGDDKEFEDSYYGWYGQTSILMVYTDFWMILFSFGFLVTFQVKNYLGRKQSVKEEDEAEVDKNTAATTSSDGNSSDTAYYRAPSESQMV